MADRFPQDAHLQLNNAAEIVGKVLPDLSVKVFQATDFGSNIGMIIPHFLWKSRDNSRDMYGWLSRCAQSRFHRSRSSRRCHTPVQRDLL